MATQRTTTPTIPHQIPRTIPTLSASLDPARPRQRIRPFVHLARRLEAHFDGIINTIKLGLTNGLIEGINAKIRLINARGYGHHTAKSLTSMIYLMLGGIGVDP